jgi:signal peptidase I
MAKRAGVKTRRIPGWLELILLLAMAVVLSIVIKTFFVQMFFVPSESMEPLFVTDDRILVQKVSYWDGDVQRGDVIVFEDPGGWLGPGPGLGPVQKALSTVGLYPTGGHLVKRVIAVGGDEVACCDDSGRVTVNGVALDERDYLRRGVAPSAREFEVTVPEGRLWMMGDNRGNSEDSRYHQRLEGSGTIPVENVVGKVWAIVWPVGRLEHIERPETFEQDGLNATPPEAFAHVVG